MKLSHPSLGWLCFQFVSAAAAATTFASDMSKPFELDIRYLGQRKHRCGKMYWVTLTQGHGCDIDKQKLACLLDKVITTQPITTKLGSYISLVMVITWLDFGGILFETFFFANIFFENFGCFFKVKHCYWTYLRNGWSNWCETKRRCISSILGKLCDLDLWPHPWPWPLIFQGQISK